MKFCEVHQLKWKKPSFWHYLCFLKIITDYWCCRLSNRTLVEDGLSLNGTTLFELRYDESEHRFIAPQNIQFDEITNCSLSNFCDIVLFSHSPCTAFPLKREQRNRLICQQILYKCQWTSRNKTKIQYHCECGVLWNHESFFFSVRCILNIENWTTWLLTDPLVSAITTINIIIFVTNTITIFITDKIFLRLTKKFDQSEKAILIAFVFPAGNNQGKIWKYLTLGLYHVFCYFCSFSLIKRAA